jgi:hypothetical protein
MDVPALRRLLEFPKPDADIVLRHVFAAINTALAGLQPDAPRRYIDCPNCDAPLEPPVPEIQIDRLREWHMGHVAYFQWSPYELRRLMESLKPGDVIIPKYAHSCDIRRANGRIRSYLRAGAAEAVCGARSHRCFRERKFRAASRHFGAIVASNSRNYRPIN